MVNLKELSSARMISIGEAWLDPARDRAKFQQLAAGQSLLTLIQSAHEGLVATQRSQDPTSREVVAILEKQARLDKRHDRKIRALYYLLNGLAEASDDPNEAAAFVTARDELLPKGLSVTKEGYREEAQNVDLASRRVSASSQGLLKKIALRRSTLWNLVEDWFAAGRELGELERQKDRLEATPGGSAGEALRAKNTWIRVVTHIESTLELEGASEELKTAILHQVREAEQVIERSGMFQVDDGPRSF
ncbi:MAG TPA: hypothetical protein PK156_21490 [Polyangium sp.]|nr:hypothetical protein [Polyangium sp.]